MVTVPTQCHFTDDIELIYVKCLVLCMVRCKKLICINAYYLSDRLLVNLDALL